MTQRLRWPIALAVAGGLVAAVWAIGQVGLRQLVDAALQLGVGGFLTLCAGTLVLMGVLGAAWWVAMPPAEPSRLPLFAWARLAREGSNDLLPFSQLGGIVIGARTLTAVGLPVTRVYAALIVDLTTEMAGQLVIVLYGLWALGAMLLHGQNQGLSTAAWTGAGMAVAIVVAFVSLQRPLLSFLDTMATRMLPDADLPLGRIRAELDLLYTRHRWPVAASFLLNILAWLGTAMLAWVGLALMGVDAPFSRVVAVESLISVVKSAAFLIPGALGVQEAAYLLLAQAFGIDPQAMLALSVVKRARDVALGLPTLLIWWAADMRRNPHPA